MINMTQKAIDAGAQAETVRLTKEKRQELGVDFVIDPVSHTVVLIHDSERQDFFDRGWEEYDIK